MVSVEDVERSPIFALTDILPACGFLLLISMVSFLELFSTDPSIEESLSLAPSEALESTEPTLESLEPDTNG